MGKFYATTITLKILSDRDVNNLDLKDLIEESDTGDCVLSILQRDVVELTGEQVAEDLIEAGSDPSFFNLDEDGNEIN